MKEVDFISISTNDIITAVCREFHAIRPSFTFYTDFFPKDFERPSVLITLVKISPAKLLNKSIFEKTVYLSATYFGNTNEYYRADKSGLYDVTDDFINCFNSGKLLCKDRYLDISASSGGDDAGEAYINLTLQYTEAVADTTTLPPNMEHFNLKIGGI